MVLDELIDKLVALKEAQPECADMHVNLYMEYRGCSEVTTVDIVNTHPAYLQAYGGPLQYVEIGVKP